MKIVKSNEMKAIDKYTIENLKFPGIILMENAARLITDDVMKCCSVTDKKKIAVVCGKGNNGGDGLATARQLFLKGYEAKIFMTNSETDISDDALTNFNMAKNIGMEIFYLKKAEDMLKFKFYITTSDIIIDAIFGTGLSKDIDKYYSRIFSDINNSKAYVISIDIPSGINSDDGKLYRNAVKADKTFALQLPKIGNILYPGSEYNGQLVIGDIGIPKISTNKTDCKINTIDLRDIKNIIVPRKKNSHKGIYGKVGFLSGSKGMAGASVLNSEGALKSGAGLVKLLITDCIYNIVETSTLEAITHTFDENNDYIDIMRTELLDYADVIATGSGCTNLKNYESVLKYLIKYTHKTLVIDAEGLNIISNDIKILEKHRKDIILTPHLGEFAKMVDKDISNIENNLVDIAVDFTLKYDVYLVLKGARTLIVLPDGSVFINTTGNPGMSTAGSGDVLTGIIASLIGQNFEIISALKAAVYLHGLSGDIASNKLGEYSMTAYDIANFLSEAFNKVLQ